MDALNPTQLVEANIFVLETDVWRSTLPNVVLGSSTGGLTAFDEFLGALPGPSRDRNAIQAAGFDDHIVRPLKPEDLARALQPRSQVGSSQSSYRSTAVVHAVPKFSPLILQGRQEAPC